jgi:hypothetical protein
MHNGVASDRRLQPFFLLVLIRIHSNDFPVERSRTINALLTFSRETGYLGPSPCAAVVLLS